MTKSIVAFCYFAKACIPTVIYTVWSLLCRSYSSELLLFALIGGHSLSNRDSCYLLYIGFKLSNFTASSLSVSAIESTIYKAEKSCNFLKVFSCKMLVSLQSRFQWQFLILLSWGFVVCCSMFWLHILGLWMLGSTWLIVCKLLGVEYFLYWGRDFSKDGVERFLNLWLASAVVYRYWYKSCREVASRD